MDLRSLINHTKFERPSVHSRRSPYSLGDVKQRPVSLPGIESSVGPIDIIQMLRLSSNKLRQAHCSSSLHPLRIRKRDYLVAFRRSLYFQRPEELQSCRTFPVHSPDNEDLPPLLYQWQEGVENLETYSPGGYHPTHIGDRYQNNRYEVVHKLGFGSLDGLAGQGPSQKPLCRSHDNCCNSLRGEPRGRNID